MKEAWGFVLPAESNRCVTLRAYVGVVAAAVVVVVPAAVLLLLILLLLSSLLLLLPFSPCPHQRRPPQTSPHQRRPQALCLHVLRHAFHSVAVSCLLVFSGLFRLAPLAPLVLSCLVPLPRVIEKSRGPRAAAEAALKHCTLQDATFLRPLELCGPRGGILGVLSTVTDPLDARATRRESCVDGFVEAKTHLYR